MTVCQRFIRRIGTLQKSKGPHWEGLVDLCGLAVDQVVPAKFVGNFTVSEIVQRF